MLQPTVDVADDFIRVDLAPSRTVKIRNSGRRNCQAFQFLLGNRVSDPAHIALDISLRELGHCPGLLHLPV